jgi:CelD/BcsL family acetyltransferase involved in cellulose biosynthesis
VSGTPIAVREITTEDGFDGLQSTWDDLADRLPLRSPFLSWEWSRLWWRHFAGPNKLRILLFERGDEPIGIAQFQQRRQGIGPLGITSLLPIGWQDGGWGLTEQLELLFPAAARSQLLTVLSIWMLQKRWSAAWLPSLPVSEPVPAPLARQVAKMAKPMSYPYRELPSAWEAFVSGLNKSMRDNVKYYPRLMARSGCDYTWQIAQTPHDLSACLPTFFDLHRARAQAPMRPAHRDRFRLPERRAFLREIAPLLAAHGQLKVGLVRVRGETVAAQMWLEKGNVLFIYYSGHLPSWSKYSVGMVATLETIKDGIARGLSRVEFLKGDGQFKSRWDTRNRMHQHVLWGRWPLLLRPVIALRAAHRWVSQRNKRRLARAMPR